MVDLAALTSASLIVQIHTAAALVAAAVGVLVLLAKKGTRYHRTIGYCFAAFIIVTAVSSFWIIGIMPGRYSPIHILSVITVVSMPLAIYYRRQATLKAHASAMISPYIRLVIAGAATPLPGRVMHAVFLAERVARQKL